MKPFFLLLTLALPALSFAFDVDVVNSNHRYYVCVVSDHYIGRVSEKLVVIDTKKPEVSFHYENRTSIPFTITHQGWGRWDIFTGGYKAHLDLGGLVKLSTANSLTAIEVPGLDEDWTTFTPCTSVDTLNMEKAHSWADKKIQAYRR